MKKDQLLNSKDLAQIFDMSPDDVLALARKGEIMGTKKNRFWRFTQADVRAYQRKVARSGK